MWAWLRNSRELVNITYNLSEANKVYAAQFLSLLTGQHASEATKYFAEIEADQELRDHIIKLTIASDERFVADEEVRYGRRIMYYALTRMTKPKLIVEGGVDKGLATVVLGKALMLNRAEGHDGKLIGIDFATKAGYLVKPPYDEPTELVFSDSVAALEKIEGPIDLFIHETVGSNEVPHAKLLETRMAEKGILFSCWHTGAFQDFAVRTGRNFLLFHEELADHWYPGADLAVVFPSA